MTILKKHWITYFLLLVFVSANAQTPRYNEVFQAATHNSYWVKRTIGIDFFAGGVQERVLDQLLFDHVRTLEIDIHKKRGEKGNWEVFHAAKKKNSFFADLPAFLQQLLQFHNALPQHEVVTVILELKEVSAFNFDETHTPADLDKLIADYIGPLLFKPADLMKRCPRDTVLCDCAASSPNIWPTTQELRGKFIFVVLGNWHWRFLGHGGLGWATYANSPDPVAFPMSSGFSEFNNKGKKEEMIPPAMLARAYRQSIFKQVEELGDTSVPSFIKHGGIVRSGEASSITRQHDFLEEGFQMFMTDYPWLQYDDKGFTRPLRPIDSLRFTDTSVFAEPGNRIFMGGLKNKFWSLNITSAKADWETLPSSTRTATNAQYPNIANANGKGCLRAESADGKDFISACRKVEEGQYAVISVEIVSNGIRRMERFAAKGPGRVLAGDMIRMVIEQNSNGSFHTVVYTSAACRESNERVYPVWRELINTKFNQPLLRQGLATGAGDVLFVGTKLNGVNVEERNFVK